MRFLFLCNKSPYPAREGGPIAMNSLISGLLKAGHQVKILAVNSDKYNVKPSDIPDEYQKITGIELIHIDLRIKPIPAFLNLFTGRSYHVERFISNSFNQKLSRLLQLEYFDVVQFETVFMAPYIETVRKYSKATLVLRAHNIEHLIWERTAKATTKPLKKWYLVNLSKTLKNYELSVLDQFDKIAAITPDDARFFALQTKKPVEAIPFGIDLDKYEFITLPPENPSLFHLGSMNWIPNEEGMKWFLDKVWPIVTIQHPDLKLYLAGRCMPDWLLKLQLTNVEVLGEVVDAKQFISSKSIAIVPLLSGSGIRIKIIEAMALGRAIVSTSIGAEGIMVSNEIDLLIADEPVAFAKAIHRLVLNPKHSAEMGAHARISIEEKYDNRKIIEKYCTWVGFF
ncbi:MAG: glycosyltransferase family 4 protein [Bacteroidales bacterium]